MTNYLYSVDVRNFNAGSPAAAPTQKQTHEYVISELNFFKGQLSDAMLEESHIIAIPVYGDTSLDVLF